MGRGDTPNSTLVLCPCGCGIPITTKKGIRYRDAKSPAQLEKHFRGKRNPKNKFTGVVK